MSEAEIHQFFRALSSSWEQNDASAIQELYTEDSDYVTFDGSWLRGVEENQALHRALFAGILAGVRLESEIESIRFLTPEVAVVISKGALLWPWHKKSPKGRLSRQTMTLIKQGERWKIAAFQNTRIKPSPPLAHPMTRLFARFIHWRLARWR